MAQFPSLLAQFNGQALPGAEGRIVAVEDLEGTTALPITDLNGIAFPGGVLQASAAGVLPAFRLPGRVTVVSWISGTYRMDIPATDILPTGGDVGDVLTIGDAGQLAWGSGASGGGGASLPPGGTTGQALVKRSNTDGDAVWASISAGGNVLVLGSSDPVPAGTPAGTIIVRTSGSTPTPDPGTDPGTNPDPSPTPTNTPTAVTSGLKWVGGTSAQTTVAVDRPTGLQSGDLVLFAYHNQNGGGVITPPSGAFTLADSPAQDARKLALYGYQVGDPAAVPATFSFSYTVSGGRTVIVAFIVRGAASSGDRVSGTSLTSVNDAAVATIPAFDVATNSLVVVLGQSQITAGQAALPTSYDRTGFTRVTDQMNNPNTASTATQSTLSIWVGPASAGNFASSKLSWASAPAARAAMAVAIKGTPIATPLAMRVAAVEEE